MAKHIVKVPVSALPIPLVSDENGNTVFIASKMEYKPDLPQPIWLENVVPTKFGLKSVIYTDKLDVPLPIGITEFKPTREVYTIFLYSDSGETTILMYYDGQLWVYNLRLAAWEILNVGNPDLTEPPTVAVVQGVYYIYHPSFGIKTYDIVTSSLVAVTLQGIDINNVDGISSANNYLVLWYQGRIYWSSPADATEFRPIVNNVATGAGSASIQALKGIIILVAPLNQGLIIYTNYNCISMRFTQNTNNPWSFKEIPNAAGVVNRKEVTFDASLDNHFAWTSSGLLAINEQSANIIFPEVSDFLEGNVFERRVAGSMFTLEKSNFTEMKVRLAFVSSRYLCISYGPDLDDVPYEFCLIYDTALKQWGKLAVKHYEMFADLVLNTGALTIAQLVNPISFYSATTIKALGGSPKLFLPDQNSIGILVKDETTGSLKILKVDFSGRSLSSYDVDSVILFKDVNIRKNTATRLLEIDFSRFEQAGGAVQVQTTYPDGSTLITTPVQTPMLPDSKYLLVAEGFHHTVGIRGRFTITNLDFSMVESGYI